MNRSRSLPGTPVRRTSRGRSRAARGDAARGAPRGAGRASASRCGGTERSPAGAEGPLLSPPGAGTGPSVSVAACGFCRHHVQSPPFDPVPDTTKVNRSTTLSDSIRPVFRWSRSAPGSAPSLSRIPPSRPGAPRASCHRAPHSPGGRPSPGPTVRGRLAQNLRRLRGGDVELSRHSTTAHGQPAGRRRRSRGPGDEDGVTTTGPGPSRDAPRSSAIRTASSTSVSTMSDSGTVLITSPFTPEGQARRHGDRVLLRDAHVDDPLGRCCIGSRPAAPAWPP
ncbi:hypothetical protein SFUMM280S_03142 [Streptomyces fumanus]